MKEGRYHVSRPPHEYHSNCDHSNCDHTKNQAFGYTNALLDLVAELKQPILHFWTMQPTVIMGLKDKRLPDLTAAIKAIQRHGYDYVLRNSGGWPWLVMPVS
ncbi:hypothetical protein V4M49_11190 [Levilactobacillus brevis]